MKESEFDELVVYCGNEFAWNTVCALDFKVKSLESIIDFQCNEISKLQDKVDSLLTLIKSRE